MIPRSFEYHSPRTLDEAISLLQKLGPDAKLLSGGQSLIPMMKLRLVSPEHIVDINRIPDLDYISANNGHLRIGALAREHELESSDVVKSKFPILSDTAKVIADPLVRSQATVCGNLAHGDPANDHPATMASRVQVMWSSQSRRIWSWRASWAAVCGSRTVATAPP